MSGEGGVRWGFDRYWDGVKVTSLAFSRETSERLYFYSERQRREVWEKKKRFPFETEAEALRAAADRLRNYIDDHERELKVMARDLGRTLERLRELGEPAT